MLYQMFNDSTLDIGLWIIMLVVASAVHESAHAWVASLCGDDTAKNAGRISLNPMVHISLWDSILLPAMFLFMSGGRFILGGANPVPIVASKLKNPDRDLALATLAGPVSNLILVLLTTVLLLLVKICLSGQVGLPVYYFIRNVILNFIVLNLILVFFNLLPIPPLDGSRVFRYLVPPVRPLYDALDEWGLAVLILVLISVPGIQTLISYAILWSLSVVIYLYHLMPG